MEILSELRHKFLILGFAGPLRSGCTTSAEFFSDGSINTEIKRLLSSENNLQKDIESLYRVLYAIKTTQAINDLSRREELGNKSSELRELLKKREILKTFKHFEANQNFIRISMTEMIFKRIIEDIKTFIKIPPGIEKREMKKKFINELEKIIRSEFPANQQKSIRAINSRIKGRKLDKLNDRDFEKYEAYLQSITKLCKKTKDGLGIFTAEDAVEMLQDFGDNLRRCGAAFNYDENVRQSRSIFVLAEEANNLIKYYGAKQRRMFPDQARQFVIEAFRNPYEVEYFRDRYYEFYLVSLFADLTQRKSRQDFSPGRDERDKGKGIKPDSSHMQNVSECVRLSDIAITNNSTRDELNRKLLQYFALIKQPGCFAPEWGETAMHMAYSMSVRSTCISRQVGAVIEGPNGYIVGAGWNDVGRGQVGCGYRCYADFKNLDSGVLPSHRKEDEAFRNSHLKNHEDQYESFCFKDEYSKFEMNNKIDKAIRKTTQNAKKEDIPDTIREELSSTKRLEYCRALHAEENAILQNAILGGIGVRNGVMYTTTFPCELCAKKIYQSGIKKVVYTEPYPESLSQEVFFKDGLRRIELMQFEGVKSHSYYRLYKSTVNKKEIMVLNKLG